MKTTFYQLFVAIILFSCNGKSTIYQSHTILSKAEAFADLDSLVYAMQEIHPDLFFECNESKFFGMLNDVRKKLSHDSISVIEFYKYAQPLTTILGDGHTQLYFPKNELTDNLFFPLSVYINQNDSSIKVNTDYNSKEGVIEKGTKILSINGVNYKCIIENMLKYCGGERFFFRLSKVNRDFPYMLYMLYPSASFELRCLEMVSKKFTK